MGGVVRVGQEARSPRPAYPPPPAHTAPGKIALLALTLAPLLYLGVFFLWFLGEFSGWGDWTPRAGIIFSAHCTAILVGVALQAWYTYAAVKNPALDQTMRIVWILVLFQFNMLAMPVYWYRHVWHAPNHQPTQSDAI